MAEQHTNPPIRALLSDLTNESVERFRAYLLENTTPNTQRSFDYLLAEFEKEFSGQNVSELSPAKLQEFLHSRWGNGKISALRQNLSKLKWFYSWYIKYIQVNGLPPLLNPCDLIDIKADGDTASKSEFVPVERMGEFLNTMKDERHWLMTAILMTAGLRASELIGDPRAGKQGLFRANINRRVLTIIKPKSGIEEEIAVIPEWVAEPLDNYLKRLNPDERIFPVSYATLHGVIRTHGKWLKLNLTPNYLRKWIASYWQRQGESSMTSFILRHYSLKVNDTTSVKTLGWENIYVVPLSPKEVAEKQDKFLTESIFFPH